MESPKRTVNNPNQIGAILEGREKRYLRQTELTKAHGAPLISLSVNVPGPDKTAQIWSQVLSVGLGELERKLNENNLRILFREMDSSPAGYVSFLLVKADPVCLKRLAMDIENDHPLGRLLDLDVFDRLGAPLSRDDLGGSKRTCVICSDQVSLCRRSAKHTAAEVLSRLTKIAEGYFSTLESPSAPAGGDLFGLESPAAKAPSPSAPAGCDLSTLESPAAKAPSPSAQAGADLSGLENPAAKAPRPPAKAQQPLSFPISHSKFSGLLTAENFDLAQELASLAAQSLIYEVSRFPAPGLVSPVSNGAHRDMNYYTFVDSVGALTKYFVLIAAAGYSNQSEEEIFLTIREIGKEAERAMFLKTQGVNTHKGAIFLLGLSLAAVAKTLYTRGSFLDVPSIIRAMTRDLISSDLDRTKLLQKTQPTHGEKIWLDHNISGIRAEAQAGFPTVFDRALPVYENSKDLSQNDRLVNALIEIMGHCQDTTIVHRHSPEVLFEVREKASKIMAAGGTRTLTGRAMIEALQNEFISRNISPGGSADLLGLTVFLSLVKN